MHPPNPNGANFKHDWVLNEVGHLLSKSCAFPQSGGPCSSGQINLLFCDKAVQVVVLDLDLSAGILMILSSASVSQDSIILIEIIAPLQYFAFLHFLRFFSVLIRLILDTFQLFALPQLRRHVGDVKSFHLIPNFGCFGGFCLTSGNET